MTKFEEIKAARSLKKELQLEVMWQAREYMASNRSPQWVMADDHELLVDRTGFEIAGIKRVWFDVLSNEFFANKRNNK